MLEVTSTAVETQLNVDFAEIYANSDLYQLVALDKFVSIYKVLNKPYSLEIDLSLHFIVTFSGEIKNSSKN